MNTVKNTVYKNAEATPIIAFMDLKQAEQFVHDVLRIWERGQKDLLDKFYDPNVIGYYRGQSIGLSQLKTRMNYINKRYPKRKFYLGEFILLDSETILFQVRHSGLDIFYKKIYTSDIVVVLRIENSVIKKFWFMSNITFDFTAGTENHKIPACEKLSIEQVERKLFEEKMLDYQYFVHGKKVKLTLREKECLYYFLEGYTAKEMAKMLKLTYRTVQDYLAKIKHKYECSTKQQLREKIFPTVNI